MHSVETGILTSNLVVVARFASYIRIDRRTGCWLWEGARIRGYGRFSIGRACRCTHRVMFELATGRPIRSGLVIDHLCRRTGCVNPRHLREVTQKQNVNAGDRHKPKKICRNGHDMQGDNVIVSKRGWRYCRMCQLNWKRAWRKRRRDQYA